jgi:hypothetical protein
MSTQEAKGNNIAMETVLTARFVPRVAPESPEEQASIDALNMHAEEIAEKLQPVFRDLVLSMLELKRPHFTTPKVEEEDNVNEGSE